MCQAPDQRSNSTAMEGYIGMEREAVAPSTLPATIMLPHQGDGRAQNLVVPTAVSASHVAFSAVRLEPTWMMLGSAAGVIATRAIQHATESSRSSALGPPTAYVDLADVSTSFLHPQSRCFNCPTFDVVRALL